MNDLLYTFQLICQRRGVDLAKVESVAFNVKINFGLATGTELLPAVANVFYYCRSLFVANRSITGVPVLIFNNTGQGSAGNSEIVWPTYGIVLSAFECDSLAYDVNTHSAGYGFVYGTVYQITYA